jgi:hypothetical protein
MNSAVLRIHWHNLRSRSSSYSLHKRSGCDQRFLVGKRKTPACGESGQRHREAGKSDDCVEDNLAQLGCGTKPLRPRNDINR